MSSKNSSKLNVPEAKAAMDKFKMEAASEVGVNLKNGYNGDLTSREAGSVGGQMVKKMIESYEKNLKPLPQTGRPAKSRTPLFAYRHHCPGQLAFSVNISLKHRYRVSQLRQTAGWKKYSGKLPAAAISSPLLCVSPVFWQSPIPER